MAQAHSLGPNEIQWLNGFLNYIQDTAGGLVIPCADVNTYFFNDPCQLSLIQVTVDQL